MNIDVLCQLKHLWKTAFQDSDEGIEAFFATAFAPERCVYTCLDGKVVCALYWMDAHCRGQKLAYLYALATLPEYRGQGLASRLIRQAHEAMAAQGCAGVVLAPVEGLFSYYAGLGYVPSGFVSSFSAAAGAEPAKLERLRQADYCRRRRPLLPEDAVLQDGEAMEYLATFADFYAAGSTLVCAARDWPEIMEYLGDPRDAPGILAALGMEEATIPVPGSDTLRSVYYPLSCQTVPGYLGFPMF